MIHTTCPHCGKSLRVKETALGKAVRCPACAQRVAIQAASEPPPTDETDNLKALAQMESEATGVVSVPEPATEKDSPTLGYVPPRRKSRVPRALTVSGLLQQTKAATEWLRGDYWKRRTKNIVFATIGHFGTVVGVISAPLIWYAAAVGVAYGDPELANGSLLMAFIGGFLVLGAIVAGACICALYFAFVMFLIDTGRVLLVILGVFLLLCGGGLQAGFFAAGIVASSFLFGMVGYFVASPIGLVVGLVRLKRS